MLFAVAMEPSAEGIWSHLGKYGYNTRLTTNKISHYKANIDHVVNLSAGGSIIFFFLVLNISKDSLG